MRLQLQHYHDQFLPMSRSECAQEGQLDVILVTGDAYVDHPAWGVAAIGRWLESHGYSVGIIAQPDWRTVDAFKALGRPRLFFGVTAGNMDTMVNKFTASRRLRSNDAYSPGGALGHRPDRATIRYTSRVKQAFPGVPVIVGGVEASSPLGPLRLLARQKSAGPFYSSQSRPIGFGMGELTVVEIANRLSQGGNIASCRDLPGVAYASGSKESLYVSDAGPPQSGGLQIRPSSFGTSYSGHVQGKQSSMWTTLVAGPWFTLGGSESAVSFEYTRTRPTA